MNIIEAKYSPALFAPAYKNIESWRAWDPALKAIYAIPMNKKELAVYRKHTGRKKPPKREMKEFWGICGRRSGKTFTAAAKIIVFEALFRAQEHRKHLAIGEPGICMIISVDRLQSQTVMRYIKGILHSSRVFEQYIKEEMKEIIELTNGMRIEVHTCNFRSVRGRSVVVCVLDEIAFFMTDGQKSDHELLSAIRPAMLTVPSSKLIAISSPYARSGVLYEHWRDYYSKDDPDVLVWQAPTTDMNPLVNQAFIDKELQKDPSGARAEYLAEFRSDIEQFLSLEALEACIIPNRRSLPASDHILYQGFADPSGGRADSFTLGISHIEKERLVIDQLRAWAPPFDPDQVTVEIASILKQYRISSVVGDRYAGEWVTASFQKQGISYTPCDLTKSDLYLSFEARVNMGTVELPDNKDMVNQLTSLERRRGRSGKDSIDHPPRSHDDLANAVAGASYEGFRNVGLLLPDLVARIQRREQAGNEHPTPPGGPGA